MKVPSSGDVGLVFLVLDGVGRGRDSLILSCMRQGGAFANLSHVKRGEIFVELDEGAWVVLVEDLGLPVASGFDIAEHQPFYEEPLFIDGKSHRPGVC